MQLRMVHTDISKVPDFSAYRVESTRDPTSRAQDSDVQRKAFIYTMMFGESL